MKDTQKSIIYNATRRAYIGGKRKASAKKFTTDAAFAYINARGGNNTYIVIDLE